jgi:uncharacterized protein YukE
MEFLHPALSRSALSDQVIKLSVAGERAGATSDPIAELHKLDCVPTEIHALANEVTAAAEVLFEVSDDFERTRNNLLRKWRGEAADAFADSSLQLLTSYLARRRNAKATGQAGTEIADDLDGVAGQAAQVGKQVADEVEPACDIVITQTDEGFEEAKEAVRTAIDAIRDMVAEKQDEIVEIGSRLDRIGTS